MGARLTLAKSMMDSENEMVRKVLANVREEGTSRWNKILEEYLGQVGMKYEDLEMWSKEKIKRKVREWDTKEWEREIGEKGMIKLYKEYKKNMGYEGCYNNNENSKMLIRARSNTLKLNKWNERVGGPGAGRCDLCGEGDAYMVLFIPNCKTLENKRDGELMREVEGMGEREALGKLLFKGKKWGKIRGMLMRLWRERESILEGRGRVGVG